MFFEPEGERVIPLWLFKEIKEDYRQHLQAELSKGKRR
jgi:hypothetical protein